MLIIPADINLKGRYLAFAYTVPLGGMADCIGGFDAIEWADAAIARLDPLPTYAYVWDTHSGSFVGAVGLRVSGEGMVPPDGQ